MEYTNTAGEQSLIYNNTIYGTFTTGALYLGSHTSNSPTAPDVTNQDHFKNNLIINLHPTAPDVSYDTLNTNDQFGFAYNAGYCASGSTVGSLRGNKTLISASDLFINTTPGEEDLHLRWNAPVINLGAGTDLTESSPDFLSVPVTDIDDQERFGVPRYGESFTCDMGADQVKRQPKTTKIILTHHTDV